MFKKKFKIIALGCRTNQYEAQAFHDQLEGLGYEPAQDGEEAELCIVNTCTVTASADSSSRHEIRKLAKNHPHAKLMVTGCYAERDPDAIRQIDGVDAVVPNRDKEELIRQLFPDAENLPEFEINRFDAHTRAFVKVQDGCNSFCTYCIIPYVRGRSRSRPTKEIVEEASRLVDEGFKEIVLTGINIGDFDGGGTGETLAGLIRAVDKVPGLERIRVSSIDPDEVDSALQDAILEGEKTCHSMHIVLQSGSNVVLKRMNRKYTRQMFMETIDRLRTAAPRFTFTTDVIVGFPGETDRDFEETKEVMDWVKFSHVHMFPYSDRPRTRANLYKDKIADQIKNQRKQELLRLAERHAYEMRKAYLGDKAVVLTESRDHHEPGVMTGYTDNFLPVRVHEPDLQSNASVKVKLVDNTPKGLIGELCR